MTGIVKEHGGFVDKYVGDAIIAVFGAPQDDPDHALHAVQSALACDKRLQELQGSFGLPDNIEVATRIGINTGEMLVGNIGSSNRLNYTIMGDAVNLAARLEGVNKVYGTTVMASDTTVGQCGDKIQFRELDMVRVKGRETPVTIYEPLHREEIEPSKLYAFAEALQHWRDSDFSGARERFAALSEQGDNAAARFVQRAEHMLSNPPPSNWDKVNTLDSK
jgi:adenylate cyclase